MPGDTSNSVRGTLGGGAQSIARSAFDRWVNIFFFWKKLLDAFSGIMNEKQKDWHKMFPVRILCSKEWIQFISYYSHNKIETFLKIIILAAQQKQKQKETLIFLDKINSQSW